MNEEPSPQSLAASRTSRSQRWQWFCGYCGTHPDQGEEPAPTRVCASCGLGLLLEAPEAVAPARRDAFFVVDSELLLRAVSQRAERLLEAAEPELVGERLDRVLPMTAQRGRLQRSLQLAAGGDETVRRASVVFADGGRSRRARIVSCGPVPSALVVLEK